MFIFAANAKFTTTSVLATWISFLKPHYCGQFGQSKTLSTRAASRRRRKASKLFNMSDFEPIITHGESVIDRKSVFQGHSAAISQVEHVDIFLSKLKENKKIENAFHNMWAYRIDKSDPNARVAGKSASIIQDCDDDGEQAAGGRLLNLLQILNVVNVMVVVTRWYGGIQLGPARFKHINNAARDSLVKGGFVDDGRGGESSNTSLQPKGSNKAKNKKKSK
uniref:Protein IMPACT-B n=1 Tax=Aceria tosichella TaxID=561515 RepID=A0A6G1SAK6_9ACAR